MALRTIPLYIHPHHTLGATPSMITQARLLAVLNAGRAIKDAFAANSAAILQLIKRARSPADPMQPDEALDHILSLVLDPLASSHNSTSLLDIESTRYVYTHHKNTQKRRSRHRLAEAAGFYIHPVEGQSPAEPILRARPPASDSIDSEAMQAVREFVLANKTSKPDNTPAQRWESSEQRAAREFAQEERAKWEAEQARLTPEERERNAALAKQIDEEASAADFVPDFPGTAG